MFKRWLDFLFSRNASGGSHEVLAEDALGDVSQFIPPDPERPFYFAFSMLHQADAILQARGASSEALAAYIQLVEQSAKDYFAGLPVASGRTCSIVLALKPVRQSRVWIEYHPRALDQDLHQGLVRQLEAVPSPMVQAGPVSLVMFGLLWGGVGDGELGFSLLPREWERVGDGEIPDKPLALLWPD